MIRPGALTVAVGLVVAAGARVGVAGVGFVERTAEPARTASARTVEMRNFAYAPSRLEVEVGDTVVWVNRDVAPHTVTSAGGRWDSGPLGAGAEWRVVADSAGERAYECAYHPSMRGEVVVRERAAGPERGGR